MNKCSFFFSILTFLSACSENQNQPAASPNIKITFKSRDQAIKEMPQAQREAFQKWEGSLAKTCSLKDGLALSDEARTDGGQAPSGLDGRLFLGKINNSLLFNISKNQNLVSDQPEFMMFGQPRLLDLHSSSKTTVAIAQENTTGSLEFEAKIDGTKCIILVGGVEIFSSPLFGSVPLQAYFSSDKLEKFGKNLKVPASNPMIRRGFVSASSQLATVGGMTVASNLYGDGPRPNSDSYEHAITRLTALFGLKNIANTRRYFQPMGFSNEDLSVNMESIDTVSTTQIYPFGIWANMVGREHEFVPLMKKNGDHILLTKWLIKPPQFVFEDLATQDSKQWAFELQSHFHGSLKDGGLADTMSLRLLEPEEIPSGASMLCFNQRFSALLSLVSTISTSKTLNVSSYDVMGPCASFSTDFFKDFASSKDAVENFVKLLGESHPSKAFSYNGWDNFYSRLIKSLLDQDIISILNPPNGRRGLIIHQTAENLDTFLKDPAKEKMEYARATFIDLSINAPLKGVDLASVRAKMVNAAIRFSDTLDISFLNLLQSYIDNAEQNNKFLDDSAKISDARLLQIRSIQKSFKNISLDFWIRRAFGGYLQKPQTDDEIRNLEITIDGIQSFQERENKRLGPDAPSSDAMQLRQNIFSQALGENWSKIYFSYLEKLSLLKKYTDCAQYKDVLSFLACASPHSTSVQSMSVGKGGFLYAPLRDLYWSLTNDLYRALMGVDPKDSFVKALVKNFYSPSWNQCSPNTFSVKASTLLGYIAQFKSNPAIKDDPQFKTSMNSTLANCARHLKKLNFFARRATRV